MKMKITTFMATLLLTLVALPAGAQLEELQLKTISIAQEAAEVMTPDTQWYLVWNKRVYTTQGGGYWEDKGAGEKAYMSQGVGVISNDDFASEKAQYLVRFLSTDEEGKFRIQFGTGNYMKSDLTTSATESGAAFFNVYNINGEATHIGVNVWNMGARVDQNGSGGTMATWGSGEIDYTGGNNDFTIYPIELIESSEMVLAKARLNACYGRYQDYTEYGQDPFKAKQGTDIGQYNFTDEQLELFTEYIDMAEQILTEEVEATAEEIYELIKNIEDAYAALMETYVKLTIADGNYRIVSALEWTNTERVSTGEYDENDQEIFEEITTNPTKAMYATLEGKAMWANLDSTDCRYLWKMTNNTETGFIQMMNIATDGILATCSQSTQATLTADSETELLFEFIERRENDKIVVAMKPSTGGNRAYLHCNGHSSGAGKASNIVGWEAAAGASQWILEPVSDEEVQTLVEAYAPIKNHELLVSMFQDAIAETEAAIAQTKDDQYITERSAALITSTDQFSSPFTDPTEGSFANVLSEATDTFWHSTWQEGNKQNHDHYFQVAFTEEQGPVSGTIQCRVIRRAVANDHITKLGVFGTNDEDALENADEEGWNNIGTFDLSSNTSSGQQIYSNGLTIEEEEGYRFFRFYIDGTTTGRGYGHFAYFNLYNQTIDGYTQWSKFDESVTAAIDSALVHAKAVDLDDLSIEDYNTLKAALDAFKPLLVNLSDMAAAINANKDVTELVAVGENPGFWSEDSNVSTFANTIEEAKAYLKGGVYDQAQIDAYTEAIKNSASDIFAAANPVEAGKWYAFKYDSLENFEAHGWSKANATNATLGDLYENYAAPASIEGEGDDQELVSFNALEEVTIGQAVRFINEDIINEMDQIAFRFVAQGDSAFAIQHKSGLYLSGAARSTNLTLGLTPALFNVRAVGYGKVIIETRNLKGQGYYEEPVYLHAQNSGHSLVTWNNDAVGSSSALYIEPVEGFDEGNDVQEGVYMNAKPNSMVFMCHPTGFSVEGADIYAYQGAFPDTETEGADLAYYAFNKIEQAAPGQPVLLVVGDLDEFEADDEEEEPELITINLVGDTFAAEPLATGGVHGTYAYQWVDEGTVVVGGGKFGKAGNTLVLAEGAEGTDCTRDISANTGYIVYGENVLKDAAADSFDLVFLAGRPADTAVEGDLNGDGKVDIADAVSVLELMANNIYEAAADLNDDGNVDIADFVSVLEIMSQQ